MQTAAPDLVSCKYDVERKHTVEQRIARVREALAAEQKRRQQLSDCLRMEQDDVERLEGMSFAALMATLRGVKDERLRAERDEYVAARLRHDESIASVAALEAQVAALQDESALLEGAEPRYEAALAAREREVLASGAAAGARLTALAQEMGTLRATAGELNEAMAAAHAAEAALGQVLAMLEKAAEWGQWDMWASGGLITTAIKHDHIEKAREAAGRARQKLQRLSIELADVGMEGGSLEVEVGELLGFADYFMDGFWVDWTVQRRIEEATDRVKVAGRQVVALLGRLQAEVTRITERMAALEQERRTLLEAR
jgi:chromosome segregation ATPase